MPSEAQPLRVGGVGGVALSGEQAGEGEPIVLLHGLTATRRYVVTGSRLLERSGRRVVAYDARGHGRSDPAPAPEAYGYEELTGDLRRVLDALEIERAALLGASMGAQTALRLCLEHPERVSALMLVTPAYDPERGEVEGAYDDWDRLAEGLRKGGVEGFIDAYRLERVPERWRQTVTSVLRQRLSAHEHPLAVADALRATPRSRPFESWARLGQIDTPCLVVASRDEADPDHPLAVAERYAASIPSAELLLEPAGSSPIAWQGGRLSKALLELSAA